MAQFFGQIGMIKMDKKRNKPKVRPHSWKRLRCLLSGTPVPTVEPCPWSSTLLLPSPR